MLRSSLLYLSRQQRIFDFVKNVGFARKMASRFVAGETVATALAAVEQLNAKGITASLDLLGESVSSEAEARDTGRQYLEILDRIEQKKLQANVSVKLTPDEWQHYMYERQKASEAPWTKKEEP
jgi:proline dehydrogenase